MSERVARRLSSLSAKYIAVFVLLVAVPAIGTSVYLLSSSYQDNKRALVRLQQEKAKSVAVTIDRYFLDLTKRLKTMTGMALDFSALGSQLDPLLADHAIDAFYVDANGRKTLAEDGGALSVKGNHSHDRSVQLAKRAGVYFGSVYAPQPGSNPEARAMEVVVAEFGSEGLVRSGTGVFGETLGLEVIQDLVRRMRLGTSGYVYAVDARGVPIAHPNASAFTHRSLALPQVTEALASSSTGSTVGRNLHGEKVLSTWATTVEPVGWKVFVEQPESAAFAPIRGKIWRTALLLAAFLVAGIVLSVLLARRLVRPIKKMRTAAGRIGAGAYGERIELGRRDELGGLADELNGMAASLHASVQSLEQQVEDRTRELQRTLAELSRKSRELEVASEHKSHFLANMSHELRTPLNAIIGFSELLQQQQVGELNEEQLGYVEDVIEAGRHLLALINDILDLSKVEAGKMELDLREVALRPTLESGVTMQSEAAGRNGITLGLSLSPENITVHADERKVRQVVFNLLSNAVHFTPPRGRVDVSARLYDGVVEVAVSDTGPGIAPEDQEVIFEEFRQASANGGTRPEGTGLGLPLSRRFIELHGGRLWVESVPGAGSTFRFTLPVERPV